MALLLLLVACNGGGVKGNRAEGLVLNEVLARNLTAAVDEVGEADDWIELYNGGDRPVSRKGLALSDDSTLPERWLLPEGDPIPAGGYLLLWCDSDPEQGAEHASFKLTGLGEHVLLSYVDDREATLIDEVEFALQTVDIAWARLPDGDINWVANPPSPGETNGSSS